MTFEEAALCHRLATEARVDAAATGGGRRQALLAIARDYDRLAETLHMPPSGN